jgi:hypothetical protein
MSKRDDYKEILSENVKEAKSQIRDLEDPDYNLLYDLETEGKNRKTLVDFLEDKAEVNLVTEEDKDDGQQTLSEEESGDDNHIEVETEKSSSRNKFLVIGVLVGLALGLAAGFYLNGIQSTGNPQQASQTVNQLLSGSFNGTVDAGAPVEQNGMYFFNVTLTRETVNGTQTVYQPYYMTKDAELLFPVIQQNPFVPPVPIDVQQYMGQTAQ